MDEPLQRSWGAASLLPLVRYARPPRIENHQHNTAANRLAGGFLTRSDHSRYARARGAQNTRVQKKIPSITERGSCVSVRLKKSAITRSKLSRG